MSDLIARFEREYQQYHRITDERARQQRALLAEFEKSLDDGRTLTDGLQSDLQAFAGGLMNSGYHVNTVRKKLNMLRPFFSWAYAAGLIGGDQYMGLRSVKNPRGSTGTTRPKPYTRKELDCFWLTMTNQLPLLPERGPGSQAISRWLSGKGKWRPVWRHAMRLQVEAMVWLALGGGLRRSEIFGLKVDDLHYDNEYIVVLGKADPNTGEPKRREVPFTDDMRGAVYRWLEFRALMRATHDSPWLSCWTPNYANAMHEGRFAELLGSVVGPGWTWHRFRHTCGTEWLRAGMPIEKVSRLLGHASLQQTLGYAEILEGDVARDMAKHGAAFSEAVTNRAA